MDATTLAIDAVAPPGCGALRMCAWRLVAWFLAAYPLVMAVPGSAGAASPQPDPGVEAALLYKFLSYVEWPAGAFAGDTSPIVIGVLGADALAGELRAIVANRRVGKRLIEVRRVSEHDALAGDQILFVGRGAARRVRDLAHAAEPRSVLLVTDFEGALDAGSVINLIVVEDRVRFEVSLEAAERSGLSLSSRMLAVAVWVRPGQ